MTITVENDIATVAGQLADLTQKVEKLTDDIAALRVRADSHQHNVELQEERTAIQQDRIDLAARELAEVSARIQAAADALRASI